MASLSDMKILLSEENLLVGIISKLKDQLNRLKVEELALKSKIREENIKAATGIDPTPSNSALGSVESHLALSPENEESVDINATKLDLDVKKPNQYLYDLGASMSAREEMEDDDQDEEGMEESIGLDDMEEHEAIEEQRKKYNDYHDQLKYFMKDV